MLYNNLKNNLPGPLRIKLSILKQKFLALLKRFNLRVLKIHIFGVDEKTNEKRILGIWDLESSSLAIGDLIDFLIPLLCQADFKNAKKIDIVFVYNPEKPMATPKFSSFINASNLHYHLAEIIPILNTVPKLGSVFFFDSHAHFECFLAENSARYYMKPSFAEYLNGVSAKTRGWALIRNFYLKKKFVPKLKFKPTTIKWAGAFIKKNVGTKLMVTVNLRFNSQYTLDRDSNLEAWSELFEYSKEKNPDVMFVVLGRKGQFGDRFNNFSNVIFSKDYNTNIEQDLALIQQALFHMGTTSGPTSLAFLSEDIPYVITSFRVSDRINNLWLKPESGFPWHNKELQRLLWDKESGNLLIKEFENLLGKVDKTEWRRRLNLEEINCSILEWPYIEK
jgi:hypothetical protein